MPGDRGGVIRYYTPGELAMAFEDWVLLHSDEARYLDVEEEAGFRAGATVVARRPANGTDLA